MAKESKGLSVSKAIDKAPKKRETWSQTKRVGDITEEIRVEKLDNKGYLVEINKSGEDSKGKWFHKTSKLYSEVNPLDGNEGDNPVDNLFKILKGNRK